MSVLKWMRVGQRCFFVPLGFTLEYYTRLKIVLPWIFYLKVQVEVHLGCYPSVSPHCNLLNLYAGLKFWLYFSVSRLCFRRKDAGHFGVIPHMGGILTATYDFDMGSTHFYTFWLLCSWFILVSEPIYDFNSMFLTMSLFRMYNELCWLIIIGRLFRLDMLDGAKLADLHCLSQVNSMSESFDN